VTIPHHSMEVDLLNLSFALIQHNSTRDVPTLTPPRDVPNESWKFLCNPPILSKCGL
jgi:hypothetical protein